jgi:catechol 2,3-dioxygenase-like lactoylglutathione lyase family enzyme
MAEVAVGAMSPFFIVGDVSRTIAFYRDRLGFTATFQSSEEDPFFAVLNRGGAQLMVKSDSTLEALPNPVRHPWMRWDAYVHVPDPDALAAELAGRGVSFATPLENNEDGLRGFEIADPDGHILYFGRPN